MVSFSISYLLMCRLVVELCTMLIKMPCMQSIFFQYSLLQIFQLDKLEVLQTLGTNSSETDFHPYYLHSSTVRSNLNRKRPWKYINNYIWRSFLYTTIKLSDFKIPYYYLYMLKLINIF